MKVIHDNEREKMKEYFKSAPNGGLLTVFLSKIERYFQSM